MAKLVILQGPEAGRQLPLRGSETVLGRQPDVDLRLDSPEVSRRHARVFLVNDEHFVEDLGSSNGTYLNSVKLTNRAALHDRDQIKVGPCLMIYELGDSVTAADLDVVIKAEVTAHSSNLKLFKQDSARKLQTMLEISQQLARFLDLDEVLPKLLDHLLKLFVHADRAIILLKEKDHLVVRAVQDRRPREHHGPTYSRSVVRRVMEEGIGIVAEDARADQRFAGTQTLDALGIRSFVAVPFKNRDDETLGVLQLDCFRFGTPFTAEDLHLTTAIALQASVVLENATLHGVLLQQDRMKRDLVLAREIQEGFLPTDFQPLAAGGLDLYAKVFPAREVSGDFYDFFPLDEHRLAFCIADVSGKGIPAALFMIAVRTLSRHLGLNAGSPAAALQLLNDTLAADNPTGLFVTMLFGTLDVRFGEVTICSGGHPPPLLRRGDGRVELVNCPAGRLLGFARAPLPLTNTTLTLAPGETLLLFTDGVTEALAPDRQTMFGMDRLRAAFAEPLVEQPLIETARQIKTAIDRFTTTPEDQYDDLTFLLLRRSRPGSPPDKKVEHETENRDLKK